MNSVPAIPFLPQVIGSHPTVVSMASAATVFMRQIAIKPFTPRNRHRELLVKERVASYHAVRNHIFKEKGSGGIPTIVVGGFVPDATEAVEFQRPLFREYGSIYYVNYSRNGFSPEMFCAQLADLIEDINRRGKKPVLFAVSFGCGLVRRFLDSSFNAPSLGIRGVVMASPVLCTADLIRERSERSSGVRMLESNLRRILASDGTREEEVNRQIERARRCFQSLFEAGAGNRTLSHRHLSIRRKIMDVVAHTPARGGYERVQALGAFPAPGAETIFAGPALLLLAEREEDILVPSSPTMAALRDTERRSSLFPRGKVRMVVSGRRGDEVAHASLIFHHHCYNPLIESWYDKLQAPRLFAAV